VTQTLANNAAKDAINLVATLRAYHNSAQTDPSKSHYRWYVSALLRVLTRPLANSGMVL